MKRPPRPAPDAHALPARLLSIFLLLAAAIVAIGWWAYGAMAGQAEARQHQQLEAIAGFKAAQIENWLEERRLDARTLIAPARFRQDLNDWLVSEDSNAGGQLRERLDSLRLDGNYEAVELLDRQGRSRLVAGLPHNGGGKASPALLDAVSRSTEGELVDLHLDGRFIHFYYLFPIRVGSAAVVVGYLRLRIDPRQHLFPLIQSWPTPSRSAETLIVRREGEEVLFLNELRHRPNMALNFRMPLGGDELPAAVQLQQGPFQGLDYRGLPVLAYLRPVAGTPWWMVSKIDREEVFLDMDRVAFVSIAAVLAAIAISGILLWLYWRKEQLRASLAGADDLHQRHEELEALMAAVPNVVFVAHDAEARHITGNHAANTLLGLPGEGGSAMPVSATARPPLFRAFAADGREYAQDELPMRRAMLTGQPVSGQECQVQLADGRWLWLLGHAVPLFDQAGRVRGGVSSYTDITRLKETEQILRRHRATLMQAGKIARVGAWSVEFPNGEDLASSRLRWSEETFNLFGYSPDSVEPSAALVFEHAHPEDRQRLLAQSCQAMAERRPFDCEFRIIRPDGMERTVHSRAECGFDVEGRPTHCYGAIQDITERKLAERALEMSRESYRSLFENMLDAYAACRLWYEGGVARDFIFLDVNPAFERLTGLKDAVGRRVTELLPGIRESGPELFEICSRVAQRGQPEKFEIHLEALQGWYSFAVYSPQRHQFVILFDNVTQQKQAQAAREAHQAQLEREVAARTADLLSLNKELQAFTYAASHDLKSPLRGIHSFSTLLEKHYRDRLEGDGLMFLDYIRRSAARMNQLIDDLLAHARLEQQAIDIQPVDLLAVVRAALAERQQEIGLRGAEIRLDLPPVMVLAESHGLVQVLRNLLENALKYAPPDQPPAIAIGGAGAAGRYRLWVRDNGIGFDMVYHDRIFEIFRRLHSYEEYPGSGIGLALVKKAMDRMGGRVWAESAPGQGATFHLELPACAGQEAASAQPAPEICPLGSIT